MAAVSCAPSTNNFAHVIIVIYATNKGGCLRLAEATLAVCDTDLRYFCSMSDTFDALKADSIGLSAKDLMTWTQVYIETAHARVNGRLHHPRAGRMSDYLMVQDPPYLNLTDAIVEPRDGRESYSAPYIAIRAVSVEVLVPTSEPAHKQNDKTVTQPFADVHTAPADLQMQQPPQQPDVSGAAQASMTGIEEQPAAQTDFNVSQVAQPEIQSNSFEASPKEPWQHPFSGFRPALG